MICLHIMVKRGYSSQAQLLSLTLSDGISNG